MIQFRVRSARAQQVLETAPYDRWVLPDGEVRAEFHCRINGFLVRFPGEVDFEIEAETLAVKAWPVDAENALIAETLFKNAITPILVNHQGGLSLHGSAVSCEGGAIAFLGISRSGKTTLAGAFAKFGHPFLTEDVIELVWERDRYWVQPKESELRLFRDSADFLMGEQENWQHDDEKQSIETSDLLPFCENAVPLCGVFILGDDEPNEISLAGLEPQQALAQILPHSFILDVEDKQRLKSHFSRLGDFAQRCDCFSLDFPREYSQLEKIVDQICQLKLERN
ncbi:MAG: hypothetical protein ABJP48_06650 [Erythrobacter sp.]